MPLILAVEPDKHQAAQLRNIARTRLQVELVLADSMEHALAELGDRVPDLILAPQLLSPKDEAALNDRLRTLEGAATWVQTLTIPMLAKPKSRKSPGGMLAALRRKKPQGAAIDGCDPEVFAEQCSAYLERAAAERAAYAAGGSSKVAEILSPDTGEAGAASFSAETAFETSQSAAQSDEAPRAGERFDQPTSNGSETPVYRSGLEYQAGFEMPAHQDDATSRDEREIARSDPQADVVVHVVEAYEATTPVAPVRQVADSELERIVSEPMKHSVEARNEPVALTDEPPVAVPSATGREDVIELPTPVSAKTVAPTPAIDPYRAEELRSTRDEDLQVIDLDLDALVGEIDAQSVPFATASESAQNDQVTVAAKSSTATGEDEELEVYDLDLSTLLEETEEQPPLAAAPAPEASGGSMLELEGDADAAGMTVAGDDAGMDASDITLYDLDINVLVDQIDDEPAGIEPLEIETQASSVNIPVVTPAPTPSVDLKGTSERTGARAPAIEAHTIDEVDLAGVALGTPMDASVGEPVDPNSRSTRGGGGESPRGARGVEVESPRSARAVETESPRGTRAVEVEPVLEAEPTAAEVQADNRVTIDSGIWAPLSLGVHRLWPQLEVGCTQPSRLAVVGPAESPAVAVLPAGGPTDSKRPEWLKTIKSLGRDSTQVQGDSDWSPPTPPAAPVQPPIQQRYQADAPARRHADDLRQIPVQEIAAATAAPRQPTGKTAQPSKPHTPAEPAWAKGKKRRHVKKVKKGKMSQDDWGFFDPDEVGFAALVTQLDEITENGGDHS
jgi:hypothetical protein